ncbi:hypothetical protein O181_089422 [Austropuccinia psidii MF-1]|uniref:Uncharacterized protein n=1 Tax=Austropuccinia psidii MF-1 TaxID=1389203 RepID=A0A9Q3ITJ3_9BASI|nr:hypothetical protein [Austropuccinia psidii MF-1]
MTLFDKKTFIYSSLLVFEENPTEDNQVTVERLVEETCESSPKKTLNKKRKARKLVFPGHTVQDSKEEVPNTPSNQMEVDSEVGMIPQWGKETQTSPVE